MINETIVDEEKHQLSCHVTVKNDLVIFIHNADEPEDMMQAQYIKLDEEMCDWLILKLTELKKTHFTS